jgi:hypothetical protein
VTAASARTGTKMLITGEPIKSHTFWKASALKTEVKFRTMCIVRKSTRNKPEMLIISFFPIEDENMLILLVLLFTVKNTNI